MKKTTYIIIFAFVISILIHYILFIGFNKITTSIQPKYHSSKKSSNINNKPTNIKFVKIKEKPQPQPKKQVEVKKEKQLPPKKEIKKVIKNKPIKKNKKIIKDVKTIKIPKQETKTDEIKKRYILTKEQKKIIEKEKQKQLEEYKEIQQLKRLDPLTKSYIQLYGRKYLKFTDNQKEYIKNNISSIGRITQKYLVYPAISARTKQSGTNIVEFTLHPNGDITDLRLTNSSKYTALDKNTIKTIKIAYKDYPKPKEPTKIKIYVKYILY
ncbi:MAG: energy transducer TonB [Campylobacterota bacterium]|nr:energy transducer TonB [Campylobacterota bacterium]